MVAKKQHYRIIDCPAPSIGVECTSRKGKVQRGAVPGIKRHVKAIHGKDVLAKLETAEAFGALYLGENKSVTKKPVAKKPVAKKASAKKSVSKKPVAKKAVAKQPVVKTAPSSNGLSKKPIGEIRSIAAQRGLDTKGKTKGELLKSLAS